MYGVILCAIAGLLLFVWVIRTRGTRPEFADGNGGARNLPPGPRGFPYIGFMPILAINPTKILAWLAHWYGNIMSMYLGDYRVVVLNDYHTIRDMFKEDVFSGRPDLKMLEVRNGGVRRGLVCSEGKEWVEQRKFTLRQLRDFGFGKQSMEGLVQEEVDELIKNLEKNIGTPVALQEHFDTAVLNALWRITCGERYSQDDDHTRRILQMTGADLKETQYTGPILFLPWLINVAPGLTRWNDFTFSIKSVHTFLQNIIQQHKATFQSNTARDFIDTYLQEIQSTTDPASSFYAEKGEHSLLIVLLDLFMAGADTTSTTMLWGFLFLILNPTVQLKVQQEIDAVIGHTCRPSIDHRKEMPYTEATIMEILRRSSLVPFGLFHSCTADAKFRDFDILKDTVLMANLHNVHNNEAYWGDPENFKPERFLDEDSKLIKPEAFIPFSTGKRVCPGENLARNQLFLFIVGLLQKFTFSFNPDNEKPSLTPLVGVVLSPKPYKVIITRRE